MKQNKIIVCCMILAMISCNSVPNPKLMCYDLIVDLGKEYHNGKIFSGSCYTVYEEDDTKKDEIRSYKKGIRDGVWAKYYMSGQLQYKGMAKKGEITGKYKHYRENGLLSIEGLMKNGFRDRTWKYYNLAGNLEKTEFYDNGTLEDEYYTNENIQAALEKSRSEAKAEKDSISKPNE